MRLQERGRELALFATPNASIGLMFQRLTARVLLACYGVIALYGQGLHAFLDDDDCDQVVSSALDVITPLLFAGQANQTQQHVVIESPRGHEHDCDHCPICQHQAMGQHFIAPAPANIGLEMCALLSPGRPESVHCPALFSPARPRAPPVA
jgi:hypothetical protein